jgi:hypothetical protein
MEVLQTFEAAKQGPITLVPLVQGLRAQVPAQLLTLDPFMSFSFSLTFLVKAERWHC